METLEEKAIKILDTCKKIYEIQERENPSAIMGKNEFYIHEKDGKRIINARPNYDERDYSYYFVIPDFDGVIIKKEDGNYCIKAAVKYKIGIAKKLWFAKIRIEPIYGNIEIKGKWGGNWLDHDYYDEDLTINPTPDFLAALDSLEIQVAKMYKQLCQSSGVDYASYDPEWVRELKPYNLK